MAGHDFFGAPLYIPNDVDMTAIKAQVAAGRNIFLMTYGHGTKITAKSVDMIMVGA